MYQFDVLEINKNMEIACKTTKTLFPILDDVKAGDFCNHGNHTEKIQYPNLCGLNVRDTKHLKPINSFSFMSYEQNSVRGNSESVYIQSGVGHRNRGVFINCENIFDVCSVFTAKRLICGDWVNWYDEYRKPSTNHEKYKIFESDSLVYSIFNLKSYQSSLRRINYKGQICNIKNEFFWMSKNEITELANQNNYNELYNDARTDSDRYVYTLLFGEQGIYNQLSDEAKDVLDSATNLVRLSFGVRRNFADDTNHLNSWDAGYAQLKLLWKEYYPEQFKEFRVKYKVLEDKMRPMVYELGFLIK
jgi:hypothetical protein